MKHVVIIGEHGEWNFVASLVRGFRGIGWKVSRVGWGPWRPVLLARAAFRVPSAGRYFRRSLLTSVSPIYGEQVDLVLVVKGHLLDSALVHKLRRRLDAPVVCWNPDSPFDRAISNHGGGIRKAVGAYDAYITWSSSLAAQIAHHNKTVLVIPFGVDRDIHHPEEGSGRYRDRLAFVGTYTQERAAILRRLKGWEPIVFGNGWPKIPGVELQPAVIGREYRQLVGEVRWNLNLLRPQNGDSHNMRSFEVPGCGGRQLAPCTADHQRYLHGSSTVLFTGEDELIARVSEHSPCRPTSSDTWRRENGYDQRLRELLTQLKLR